MKKHTREYAESLADSNYEDPQNLTREERLEYKAFQSGYMKVIDETKFIELYEAAVLIKDLLVENWKNPKFHENTTIRHDHIGKLVEAIQNSRGY